MKNNLHLAHCIACNVTIKCGKSDLQKHGSGIKHVKLVKSIQGVPNVIQSFKSGKSGEVKL